MQKKRVVVKVGSAILVENQLINKTRMEALVKLIAKLRDKYEVILVSSGAVAAGYTKIKLDKNHLPNKQALAAIGQPLLMQTYTDLFAPYGIVVAQVLLSAYDFDSRKRTQNARNAMEVLLQSNVLPIINENDVTATGELSLLLEFGDNDQLSAHVAHFFNAEILAILSDIEGYYEENPVHPVCAIHPAVHVFMRQGRQNHTQEQDVGHLCGHVSGRPVDCPEFQVLKNSRHDLCI